MKKTNIGTNKISCTMNKIKKMMITISTLNAKEDKFATNMMNFVEREVTSNNVIHNGDNSWKTVKPLGTQTAIPVIHIFMNNGTSAMIKSCVHGTSSHIRCTSVRSRLSLRARRGRKKAAGPNSSLAR